MSERAGVKEIQRVKDGWFARNPSLRLTAWGETVKEAEIRLLELEVLYYECLSRAKPLDIDRLRNLQARILAGLLETTDQEPKHV